jgi:hypothetical protein
MDQEIKIMNISMVEYSKKLDELKKGILSEEEWMSYCKDLMSQVLEDAKDVMIRLKERGD